MGARLLPPSGGDEALVWSYAALIKGVAGSAGPGRLKIAKWE